MLSSTFIDEVGYLSFDDKTADLLSTGCGFRVGKVRDCEIENTISKKRERTKADGKIWSSAHTNGMVCGRATS